MLSKNYILDKDEDEWGGKLSYFMGAFWVEQVQYFIVCYMVQPACIFQSWKNTEKPACLNQK